MTTLLSHKAAAAWTGLLDLVYPRSCPACGRDATDAPGTICWDCLAALTPVVRPFCETCGDPVEGSIHHAYTCAACRRSPPAFDRARSAMRYRGPLRPILQAFKYGAQPHLAYDGARFLSACVQAHYPGVPFDAVIPVPLHPRRERARAFNQSALLAHHLASDLGLPYYGRGLERVRETATQTDLSALQRRANVRDAFASTGADWFDGRRLLLVDDVMTTGATLDEVSGVLKSAGAASVHVVTVARG